MSDFDRYDVNQIKESLRDYAPPMIRGGIVLLVVLLLVSSFYRVDASDEGVVLRFGAHVKTSQPGLHFKLSWPVESVQTVPVRRIQTLEFGFKTTRPGRNTQFAPENSTQLDVAEMLTGDLNLAHVEWVVQYRIKDPVKYLFNVGDAETTPLDALPSGASQDPNAAVPDTIRDVSETVMRKLVGDKSVDAVITVGREKIGLDAMAEVQTMLDSFEIGGEIVAIKLQNTSPPDQVKDAFQEVNRARQNKERVVNEADGERNKQVPAARGKRDQAILEAEGYHERVTKENQGKVDAFLAQLKEFEKARDVTKRRLYWETMEEMLIKVEDKTIIAESLQGVLPLLNLDSNKTARSK
ncbi:MAG: FtsH protease activity modulator HflK [Planctomycetota bacterium]|nr:FtsH protease activity modulator HflK [Planctomycetota bacterium]